ncbi:MAG: hypothetical protein Q7S28_01150, partial [bacterium]|nr:hypothetical protein [bacterium]
FHESRSPSGAPPQPYTPRDPSTPLRIVRPEQPRPPQSFNPGQDRMVHPGNSERRDETPNRPSFRPPETGRMVRPSSPQVVRPSSFDKAQDKSPQGIDARPPERRYEAPNRSDFRSEPNRKIDAPPPVNRHIAQSSPASAPIRRVEPTHTEAPRSLRDALPPRPPHHPTNHHPPQRTMVDINALRDAITKAANEETKEAKPEHDQPSNPV